MNKISIKKSILLTGVGWPSKSLLNFLRFMRSSTGNRPASAQAAYKIGAACP